MAYPHSDDPMHSADFKFRVKDQNYTGNYTKNWQIKYKMQVGDEPISTT